MMELVQLMLHNAVSEQVTRDCYTSAFPPWALIQYEDVILPV